jgi:Pyruvate/2-oxoacid:ferredoxin oxidoreductase gamma subunit
MGKEPEEIEREIEETRERMGDRLDALSYKADVKSRVGDSIAEKRDNLVDKVKGLVPGNTDETPSPADMKEQAKGRVKGLISKGSERAPSREDVKQQAQRAKGMAQENPLGLAIGAVAAGFLLGLLLPSTRMEDEKLGQAADTVKAKAAETGQEALERGRQVAQDVAQTATETAKQSGSEHASELSETARQKASEAAEDVRSQAQG